MRLAAVDSDPLVRLASALSSRPAELVAAVRATAGTTWPDVLDRPERLRSLTVATYLADRRPVGSAGPVEGLPEGLTALADRVAALPRFDRAVLVLVEVEHLTRAAAAGLLDRPVTVVDHGLERALTALDADPDALAAVWSALSSRPLDPVEVRRAEQWVAGRRRTRSRRRVLVAVGVALLVATSVLPGAIRTLAPDDVWLRGHREWVLSYRLSPPDGWVIDSRTVAADLETTELKPAGAGPAHCQIVVGQIVVGQPAPDDPSRGPDRPARVHGRAARLTAVADHAVLTWGLGPDTTASVACSRMPGAGAFATTLARRMAFAPEPILLPYRLGVTPSHFHVAQVEVWPQAGRTTVDLWPDEVLASGTPIAIDQTPGSVAGTQLWSLPVSDPRVLTSCRLVETVSVCAGVAKPGAVDSPVEQSRAGRRLRMIMDGLGAAASGTDRSTWFDARTALPSE